MEESTTLSITSTTSATTSGIPFEHVTTRFVDNPSADDNSEDLEGVEVQFDSEPANAEFLVNYSICVGLYVSYVSMHPEWKETSGRALSRAMEMARNTAEEYSAFSEAYQIMALIVNRLCGMRFRQTEYMMALGLLERFIEKTKDKFEMTLSASSTAILMSLITANKLSADVSIPNIRYCEALSLNATGVLKSEMDFLGSLGMDLSFSADELQELVEICKCGAKKYRDGYY